MGCGNVELGIACGLILQGHETHQPPNFSLNPCRQRESNDVFSEGLGRYILFGENHDLQGRIERLDQSNSHMQINKCKSAATSTNIDSKHQ